MEKVMFKLIVRSLNPEKRTYHTPVILINHGMFNPKIPYVPYTNTMAAMELFEKYSALTPVGKQIVSKAHELKIDRIEVYPYRLITYSKQPRTQQLLIDSTLAGLFQSSLGEDIVFDRGFAEAVPLKIEFMLHSPTTIGKSHKFTISEDLQNGPQRRRIDALHPEVQRLIQGTFEYGVLTLHIIDNRFIVEIPPAISIEYMKSHLEARYKGYDPKVFEG